MAKATGNLNISSSRPVGNPLRVRAALFGYWLYDHPRLAPRRLAYWLTRLWLPVRYRFTVGP